VAKKKRKKGKRPGRPASRPEAAGRVEAAGRAEAEERPEPRRERAGAAPVSNRQARKEQARRERERRIRRMRRQRRLRRLVRWGLTLGIVGAVVGGIVYVNSRPLFLEDAEASETAAALGCGESQGVIDEPTNEGRTHLQPGQPGNYASVPATSGAHAAAIYAGTPVLEQPVRHNSPLEAQLVHNLEHAYVIMYYRASGAGALPDEVVSGLQRLTGQQKVLLAPYEDLPQGASVAFAAWTKLLECPGVEADQANDVVQVARAFIDEYRGSSNAPEPQGG
jgi:hypothetical protein